MRLILILFALLFLSINDRAQLKPLSKVEVPTEQQKKQSELNTHCIISNKYSADQRRKIYPFSMAASVRIISYTWPDSIVFGGPVPLKNGQLNPEYVQKEKTLSQTEIDSLTQIIYNVGYRGYFFTEVDFKCYNPRNAIIFLDSSEMVKEYIELCFECQKHRLSSDKILAGDFCQEKYDLLRSFFSQMGINYGVEKNP